MARARNIKPGFFLNEILGTADPLLSLLFAGLWCLADKEGRLEDRPLRIKAEIFPYRESLDINGYLTQLLRNGFIKRYAVQGKRYIEITNFRKHQNPHHTEKNSNIPPSCDATVNPPLDNGENPADSLIPDSLIPDSKPFVQEEKKRLVSCDSFDAFWKAYPKKIGKGAAERAWKKIKAPATTLPTILSALEWQKESDQWRKNAGEYIPHPSTYLNQKRWEDEKPKTALEEVFNV